MKIKHNLTLQLVNNPGCIIRVALVLERRGYAIESLQMKSSSEEYTEMYLVTSGDPQKLEQIQKQLSKLIDVLSVREGISTPVRRVESKENVLVLE